MFPPGRGNRQVRNFKPQGLRTDDALNKNKEVRKRSFGMQKGKTIGLARGLVVRASGSGMSSGRLENEGGTKWDKKSPGQLLAVLGF